MAAFPSDDNEFADQFLMVFFGIFHTIWLYLKYRNLKIP
jgi:hypothetical protein